MKTIKRKKKNESVKAILKVKDWFTKKQMSSLYNDFYVVATWSEYDMGDGKNVSVEGKTTEAVLRRMSSAKKIYDSIKV